MDPHVTYSQCKYICIINYKKNWSGKLCLLLQWCSVTNCDAYKMV